MVTDQLEQVYKGLGDMQKLAVGVGDLKRVLSNVKTRGTLGEIQLGSILEQYLSPEQFLKNVVVKPGTKESVEFAIKLPGNENPEEPVFLAIDSKFPVEDYQRLIEIYENLADYSKEEITKVEKAFDASVVKSARTIWQKYIPHRLPLISQSCLYQRKAFMHKFFHGQVFSNLFSAISM